jgi:hypothetical protein
MNRKEVRAPYSGTYTQLFLFSPCLRFFSFFLTSLLSLSLHTILSAMSGTILSAIEGPSIDDDAAPASASTQFPNEVVENIAHLTTDPATLASWMSVSRTMYNIVAPRLYQEGVVTRNGSLYVGCEEEVGRSCSARKRDEAKNTDEPIEAIAGLFESEEDLTGKYTPIALEYSKTQLLSMIRHLYVHEIPSAHVYRKHIALLQRNSSTAKPVLVTVSIRPKASWQLMKEVVDANREDRDAPHTFIHYMERFDIEHLCVQFPTMDQLLEDSLVPNRKMPRSFFQVQYIRMTLRRLLIGERDGRGDIFGMLNLGCQTLTIHNMTLGICDRALQSLSSWARTAVRTFFRPCTNADADMIDKLFDRYCYNHLGDGNPNIKENGDIKLGNRILHSSLPWELIDMDWRRGNYDPNRSDDPSRSLNRQFEMFAKESSPCFHQWDSERQHLVGEDGMFKSVRMSREVEACRCCGRHQLSAAEVCVVAYGAGRGNEANN